MKNIYEVLKQKEAEYAAIVSRYRKMSEEMSKLSKEIEAVKTTVKLLGDDVEDESSDEQMAAMSQPQMIRAVLAERKTEMHLSDILATVERKFHRKLKPNVTAAVIFRYAKRGSIFYKSASKPNTWGLLAFRAEEPKPESLLDIVERVERRA
jgi:hypothetical protein